MAVRCACSRLASPFRSGGALYCLAAFVCSFKTLLTSTKGNRLTSELTYWFSGLSLAGFEVTLYGRIWVTPEGFTACKLLISMGSVIGLEPVASCVSLGG